MTYKILNNLVSVDKDYFFTVNTNSQVVEDFDLEKNGMKANLVSFEVYWFVVQHIQNPKKSLSGKNFYDELTFGILP